MADDPVPDAANEPVPRLPRGRGMKFSGPQLVRLGMTLATLIGVVVLARPCANAVSNFVMSYERGDKAKPLPRPGAVEAPPPQYEQLTPGMSEAELKAAIERAKARNAAGAPGGGVVGPPPGGTSESGGSGTSGPGAP